MNQDSPQEGASGLRMHKRETTLADGRYLIFYTFDGDQTTRETEAAESANASRPEPDAQPSAEEERHV